MRGKYEKTVVRLIREVFFELFQEDESEYSVRTESDKSWGESLEESGGSDLEDVTGTVHDARVLAGLGVHETGLEHVERHGDERGNDTRAQRRREVRHEVVFEPRRTQKLMLELVVERELTDCDEHASRRRHCCACH